MYIETQILENADKEHPNKIVRYGFESYQEAIKTLRCIGVAKESYIDPADKTGKLTLPISLGSKQAEAEPRVFTADSIDRLIGEVSIRSRQLQLPASHEEKIRFLGPHKSRTLWLILNAVNTSELRLKVEKNILPADYLDKIDNAMYLMRSIGAGKKIGEIAIDHLKIQPRIRPVRLHNSVIAYDETENYSPGFPVNITVTVATSLFGQYP